MKQLTLTSHPLWRKPAAWLTARGIIGFASLLTGVRAVAPHGGLTLHPTLYFANHNSHADFVLLWASLPPHLRTLTRPVAGDDYWSTSGLRRFIATDVFNALLILRDGNNQTSDPVAQMVQALTAGDSLIMFPEGTRNMTDDEVLLPFKSGLYHVAHQVEQVRLTPVWIDNLKRVLPKGMLLPIPLACTIYIGEPLVLNEGEDKTSFLNRARAAMLALKPAHDHKRSLA